MYSQLFINLCLQSYVQLRAARKHHPSKWCDRLYGDSYLWPPNLGPRYDALDNLKHGPGQRGSSVMTEPYLDIVKTRSDVVGCMYAEIRSAVNVSQEWHNIARAAMNGPALSLLNGPMMNRMYWNDSGRAKHSATERAKFALAPAVQRNKRSSCGLQV